jgi:hypothetical protein
MQFPEKIQAEKTAGIKKQHDSLARKKYRVAFL